MIPNEFVVSREKDETVVFPEFPAHQCSWQISLHPPGNCCPRPPSFPSTTLLLLVRRAFLSFLPENLSSFGLFSYSNFLFQPWVNPYLYRWCFPWQSRSCCIRDSY